MHTWQYGQVVLNALVTNPAYHEQLVTTIKAWPSNIYAVPTIISAIQLQISTGSKSPMLKEVRTLSNVRVLDWAWHPVVFSWMIDCLLSNTWSRMPIRSWHSSPFSYNSGIGWTLCTGQAIWESSRYLRGGIILRSYLSLCVFLASTLLGSQLNTQTVCLLMIVVLLSQCTPVNGYKNVVLEHWKVPLMFY